MTYSEMWSNMKRDAHEQDSPQGASSETTGRLPRPGERHNASSIPITDRALASLLASARMAEVLNPCDVPECENCNDHHLIWWDCCNALDKSTRMALQSWLRAEGYGLPDAPWEDVDSKGHPYPHGYVGIRS